MIGNVANKHLVISQETQWLTTLAEGNANYSIIWRRCQSMALNAMPSLKPRLPRDSPAHFGPSTIELGFFMQVMLHVLNPIETVL